MYHTWETGPIRPPSEAGSLLIRISRNCPWNRCAFCPVYKRQSFEFRPLENILDDIDIAADRHPDAETVFFQDADTLVVKTGELLTILEHLNRRLPELRRVTGYARIRSAAHRPVDDLKRLRAAGLSRLHIGLESGSDELLAIMNKGANAALAVKAGSNVKAAGIELCFYVLLGLAGRLRLDARPGWEVHAEATARVLNAVDPDHIRVRTLAVRRGTPLADRRERGDFQTATEGDTVREEALLLRELEVTSRFESDHITNVLMDVRGKLPGDKEGMLATVEAFLNLSESEQLIFRLGTLFRYTGSGPSFRTFREFLENPDRTRISRLIEEREQEEPGSVRRLIDRIVQEIL